MVLSGTWIVEIIYALIYFHSSLYFIFVGDHTHLALYSKITSGGVHGDHMRYRGSNPCQLCARQEPYLLYYWSIPLHLWVSYNEALKAVKNNYEPFSQHALLGMLYLFSEHCLSWKIENTILMPTFLQFLSSEFNYFSAQLRTVLCFFSTRTSAFHIYFSIFSRN